MKIYHLKIDEKKDKTSSIMTPIRLKRKLKLALKGALNTSESGRSRLTEEIAPQNNTPKDKGYLSLREALLTTHSTNGTMNKIKKSLNVRNTDQKMDKVS